MKKILLIAAILLTFSFAANAACTRANLTGTWMVYSTGAYSYANQCKLIIPATGNAFTGSCIAADGTTTSAAGTITMIDKACHFTSNFASANVLVTDAYLNRSKDGLSGMWSQYVGAYLYSGAFNGVKLEKI